MPEYVVLWSMRGRCKVKADSADEAEEKFCEMVEDGSLVPEEDCDGYEVDDIVPSEGPTVPDKLEVVQ